MQDTVLAGHLHRQLGASRLKSEGGWGVDARVGQVYVCENIHCEVAKLSSEGLSA